MSKVTRKKRSLTILITLLSLSILTIIGVGACWFQWYYNKVSVDSVVCIGQVKKDTNIYYGNAYIETLKPLSVNNRIDTVQNQKNRLLSTDITYQIGDQAEHLDQSTIAGWLIVTGDAVSIDKDKVKAYVKGLADKYDTVGTKRAFVTFYGKKVTVSGGPYGWKINQAKEVEDLLSFIQEGQSDKNHQPEYSQEAKARGVNDIGSTYVEINMTAQHMWYFKEGELKVDTDVVTGNIRRGNKTPAMVAYIQNKVRNINLVGEDYVAFVNYWMKINGGIGIHDASWRSKFGGNIYKTNGSHGCINTPYNNMKALYNSVDEGTPVVAYYEE